MPGEENLIYEFGPYRLEPDERRLLRDGERLPLTSKVFDLLLILVRNCGHLIKKTDLIQRIWTDSFVEESNLTVAVATLRKALGQSQGRQYIETVPKAGYRFTASVKVLQNPDLNMSGGEVQRAHNGSAAATTAQANSFIGPRIGLPSIAVLPLVNVSGDPEMDYLCDGITEIITNSLAQLSQLRVVAGSALARYRARNLDPQEVGRNLGVTVVLTGIVQQRHGNLLLKTELVDVAYGWRLWGEQYFPKPSDLLSIQAEIVKEITERLRVQIIEQEKKGLAKRHTENVAAYHAYLKGRYCWNKRTVEYFRKGIKYFNQAIRLDPKFALAHVGLADCYNLLNSYGALPPKRSITRMRAAAKRALALNDQLSEAHASLGFVKMMYDWNLRDAETELKLAIKLNPNYATSRQWYANCLMMMKRFEEAMKHRKIAQELDPLSLVIQTSIASHLIFVHEYDHAIEVCREALELDPDFYVAHALIALAHAAKGTYREAISAAHRSFKISGDLEVLSLLGYTQAKAGKSDDALKVHNRLQSVARRRYVDPAYTALICLGLGRHDRVFFWLRKAFQQKSSYLAWLDLDPRMDSLRSDPRFTELLRHIWGKHY